MGNLLPLNQKNPSGASEAPAESVD